MSRIGYKTCLVALLCVCAQAPLIAQEATPTPTPTPGMTLSEKLAYQQDAALWLIAGLICSFLVLSRVKP